MIPLWTCSKAADKGVSQSECFCFSFQTATSRLFETTPYMCKSKLYQDVGGEGLQQQAPETSKKREVLPKFDGLIRFSRESALFEDLAANHHLGVHLL